jgi:glycosyltransferase involved in cell wall biosynthesis
LSQNPALREEMGRGGRRHILAHYSRQRTAETYIDVLNALLKRTPRAGSAAA